MSNVIEVTDATFEAEVLKSSLPTLVDYWADWCSPCKQLSPIIEELAGEYAGQMKFVKVDTNANLEVASQQGIQSLPTIQVFVGGEVVDQLQGGKTKASLVKTIESHL